MSRAFHTLFAAAALAVLVGACGGTGEDGLVVTTATATDTATPGIGSIPSPSSEPPTTALTETAPSPSPSGAPQSTDASLGFTTGDVRAAVESAGRTFTVLTDRAALCPNTSVSETAFKSMNADGGDFGAIWMLWVYPDAEQLAVDWEVGEAVHPRTQDCDLPTGFVYWNRNVVMAFAAWHGPGQEGAYESTYSPYNSPSDDPALMAFLELGTSPVDR